MVTAVKALLGLGEYQKYRSGSHTCKSAECVCQYHSSLGVGVGPRVG